MNQVGMIGRITKDPILRQLSEGRCQASFVLAVTRTFKNQKGEDADFVLCTVWGKLAENTVKFCGKGSMIGVSGRIQSRSYQKEDGSRVFVTEVVGEEIQFLATKPRVEDKLDLSPVTPEINLTNDFVFSEEEQRELPIT
jgi:single-strand DNA-binding protein